MKAQAYDIERLRTEGARELRPGVVGVLCCSMELFQTKTRVYQAQPRRQREIKIQNSSKEIIQGRRILTIERLKGGPAAGEGVERVAPSVVLHAA